MKALLILLFLSLAKGDKLNSVYLPPPGANYSGGGGDVEVPFEVPVEDFGTKDENETRLIPGIFRDGGIISSTFAPTYNGRKLSSTYAPTSNKRLQTSTNAPASAGRIASPSYKPSNGRIISSTYAPITYPSTTLNYNSYSTTPRPYKQLSYEVIDGLSNQPNRGKAFFLNQDSDKKGGNINSPYSSENQFENDDTDFGRPASSFEPAKTVNYNGRKNLFNSNKEINKVKYSERKVRPQEEAERNAVILNYENVITPDGFAYSFDTSNDIHADESGTASDGVKANGSYSYIGDDGKLYNITYSADEYGFRPRGDHLPTPPPVPDAILQVIEQAAKDRDNGIYDDGLYDENKYGYKKYQPIRDRILGNNDPRLTSSMRQNNGLLFKEPSNISDGSTIYKLDGRFPSDSQGDNNNNENQKGTKFIERKKSYNQVSNEFVRDNNDEFYQNLISQKSGFPSTIRIPGNKINIYNDPRDGTTNEYNNLPSITNVKQNAERISNPGSSFVTNDRKVYGPDFENILTESQNGYSYPNPNRKFGQSIPNQPSRFGQNKYNEPGLTQKTNQFATGKPTEYYSSSTESIKKFRTDTVQPNNYYSPSSEKIKEFEAYTDRPNDYYRGESLKQVGTKRPTNFNSSSSTERVRNSTTFTDRPRDYNDPSSTVRLSGYDTYTDRPRDYFNLSSIKITSTERIKPTSFFNQPSNYYNSPSSTEIQQIGTYYTDRPNNNYYRPSSTENANEFVTYTDRPKDNFYSPSIGGVLEFDTATRKPSINYGPSSTNMEFSTSTVHPKSYYGPLSTQGINEFDKITGRPSDYYNSPSTERKDFDKYTVHPNDYPSTGKIKEFETATGRPSNYNYSILSTERIKESSTATGRPTDYYAPSSTERIKDFSTTTGRPTYYAPSSTERIEDFGTATGQPTDYYSPSSTERIKDFGTATGQPTDYYSPSSTEIIKDFGTATGRPTNNYTPSFTQRIKDFGTATDRPSDYYSPLSIEKIKDSDKATGRPIHYYGPSSTERVKEPIDYYGPSSTERVKDFDTATGRPTDYYAPSSTQRIKDFSTATGRPTDYYAPSSTERKVFGTATGRPTAYYAPLSTERTIGEDFSGPHQPQRYDPETGYHY